MATQTVPEASFGAPDSPPAARLSQGAKFARTLDQHPGKVAAFLSLAYFAGALAQAARKPFWFDELFTYYLANMPTFGDIWRGISMGTECNPPLYFWLMHLVRGVTDLNEVTMRLPSIVMIWGLGVTLFFFARRHFGNLAGFAASLAALTGFPAVAAFEARGYAALMAATSGALLCWSLNPAGRKARAAASIGLAVCLAAAISVNYYGIYVTGALAAGELYLTWKRKFRLPQWIAIGAGGAALLPWLPLLRQQRTFANHFWAGSVPLQTLYAYLQSVQAISFVAPLLLLIAVARIRREQQPGARTIPAHETVALGMLVMMPVVFLFASVAIPIATHPRYYSPVLVAVAALIGLAVGRVSRSDRACAGWLVLILAIGFGGWQAFGLMLLLRPLPRETVQQHAVVNAAIEGPIAYENPLEFLQTYHYAPPEYRKRMVYVGSRDAAAEVLGYDTTEISLQAGRDLYGLPVISYSDLKKIPHFSVVRFTLECWLVKKLLQDHAEIRVADYEKERVLLGPERLVFDVRWK